MRQTLIALAALLALVGWERAAQAVILDDAAHAIRTGYYRNQMWPWPFVCDDRLAVRQPFGRMVHNGWRRQNLLGEHHFADDGDRLNTAGQLRVRWVMTQAPPDRRQIYIERSGEPMLTQQRLEAVREYAAGWADDGQMPRVSQTHVASEGRPAGAVDAANVRYFEGQQPPSMLPAATAAFGTSSN